MDRVTIDKYQISFLKRERGHYFVFRGPVRKAKFIGQVFFDDPPWWRFVPVSDPCDDLYYGKTRMEAVNAFYKFF